MSSSITINAVYADERIRSIPASSFVTVPGVPAITVFALTTSTIIFTLRSDFTSDYYMFRRIIL